MYLLKALLVFFFLLGNPHWKASIKYTCTVYISYSATILQKVRFGYVTKKGFHLLVYSLLYDWMTTKKIQSPRDTSWCRVMALNNGEKSQLILRRWVRSAYKGITANVNVFYENDNDIWYLSSQAFCLLLTHDLAKFNSYRSAVFIPGETNLLRNHEVYFYAIVPSSCK